MPGSEARTKSAQALEPHRDRGQRAGDATPAVERVHERNHHDSRGVHDRGLLPDLESRSCHERRCIEVKGRANSGEIEVTDNEWARACNLRGDYWNLNEVDTMLVAEQSGKRLRLGDTMVVQVEKVDAVRGRVDLLPVEV